MDFIPANLVATAKEVREQNSGLPERIVQRRIRDNLDVQRAKVGVLHKTGLEEINEALVESL